MTTEYLGLEFGDCIEELDFCYDNWRESPDVLLDIKDERLIETLVSTFFIENPSWMGECVPAAITFDLEWICSLFGDTSDNEFIEETKRQILRYTCGAIVGGLLHWESNAGLFDHDY